ncbi:hypothetical protein [Cognataquiflexum rubidum]|uniref:hypothetical protein n=1 Tax=Cognataquiflexum rubidum TaxID=2922273 RepID=UPI001F135E35|nr:hypothetical protein [Cognataquiflexum rubidum]MCH6233583.1 hypothetical protein [Cognataquiflexum rubidum]
MNTHPKKNLVAIQGKRGELLAAAVMLSIHGLEVSVPKASMKPIVEQALFHPDFKK